ncbi:MAG: fumarylacetoacetase, partial [Betaproteobacteria bacterium]|nr:fumarylacetoacetase [Betaproteobacteria bacterium]
MNATHDPALRSWVESANDPANEFPIQNLPLGVFRRKGAKEAPRGGVAIGDQILDLAAVGLKTGPNLNQLAAAGRRSWRELRKLLSQGLSDSRNAKRLSQYLVPMSKAELFLPT